MRIASWNVNGIRAVHKKGLFVPFVKKYKPDILCLQETKAMQNQSEVDLPDYEEYWNSADRKGYSGTAIFARSTGSTSSPQAGSQPEAGTAGQAKTKPLSVIYGLPPSIARKYKLADDGYGDPNTEGRLLTLEFKNFYVMSVYTPNAKEDLSRLSLRHKNWDPAFLAYMKELENPSTSLRTGKPVIFCGDLNVAHTPDDLARPKANEGRKGFTQEEREGIQKIVDSGFVDTFRIFTKGGGHYSWWSHFANARARNIGWRIDYIFVSKKIAKKVTSAKILPEVLGSDHCPVLIEIGN